jgi:intracellular sulfur oxidation DsrE/DsrF family protein
MKKTIVTLIALTLALVIAGLSQTAQPRKHRVVFQMNMDGAGSWDQLMGNVQNIQNAFGANNIQVEVVTYGKGISLLLKTDTVYEERMKKAVDSGVVFAVCQNSMRLRKVTVEDLFPFAAPVDAGVAELVRKQEAGWSYIRTGE